MIGTDENRAVLYVKVIFWSGKRKTPPSLMNGKYCYSPELQEYQRIAVLVSLDAIHSDLLPQYLEQAKQDGRRYLLEHAERIEGGLL